MSILRENYHDLVRHDVISKIDYDLGKVLDFGGGVGATSCELFEMGLAKEVVLADILNSDLAPPFSKIVCGDLNDASLLQGEVRASGPYETILCLDILEHLVDPWAIVRALRDCLSADGLVIASIPNVNYIGVVGPLVLKGSWDLQDEGILDRTHLRWFTRKSARALLTQAGLDIIREDAIIPPKYGVIDKVTFGAMRRFFCTQYFFVAKNKS